MSRCRRHLSLRLVLLLLVAVGLAIPVGLQTSVAAEAPVAGSEASTLQREPLLTPQEIGDGAAADLLYADPTENLSQVVPPEANSTGTAQLDYPLVLPKGRGMTPELALSYESEGGSSWAGLGWDLSVGDISVDTQWGVPLFCPRDTGPKCDNVESESYTLDGEALMPSAIRSGFLPRVAEREDFTRRVETEYERIIRHGDSPENYSWEVVDKEGAIRWYGAYPDEGGPVGAAGTRHDGRFRNDKARNPSAILTDGPGNTGNGFRWFLSAERDVGVNFFRYEYDTVTYQSGREGGGDGTVWQRIPDGQACAANRTCAKHVYLERILYTGAGEASGHDEDPAYVVEFVREQGARPDPVLDARGAFLDLDQERLDHIDVRYRDTDELVTRYKLNYDEDRFGKSRLVSVSQIGCAGGAADDCDQSTSAAHRFEYFNAPAKDAGFADPVTWDAGGGEPGGDNLDAGHQINRASALGMSETNAGDGHVYLGFNPAAPSKTGSFGGSITLEGGDTDSLVEFIDINGDTLPDKVFRSGGALKYRLNTATAGADQTASLTFTAGTAGTITGLTTLPRESEFGISGGPEAYFGVFGVFNVGGAWSWADGYFTDANADGLPDYVKSGHVLFNHLDCSTNGGRLDDKTKCKPTFSEDDASTRVPLTVDAVPVSDDSAEQALQVARELAPPVDTVRRWVAPYAGRISIGGTATLLNPPTQGDVVAEPVRVAVQLNGDELASSTLTTFGSTWTPSVATRTVAKGARIYFRTSSRPGGNGDDVRWDPSVTYVDFSSASRDANGLRQDLYQASSDFTLSGRPGAVVTLPEAGTARFTAVFDKGATSDDVAPRLQVLPSSGGDPRRENLEIVPLTSANVPDPSRVKSVEKVGDDWCVRDPSGGDFGCYSSESDASARLRYLGASEVGRFGLKTDFHVDAVNANKADAVQTWLGVDSPIDVQKITWVAQPMLCYPDASGACDEDRTNVSPPVDVEVYPVNDLTAPAAPWTSTRGHVNEVEVKLDVGADNTAGTVFVTIKKAGGGYVYKKSFGIGASGSSRTFTSDPLPGLDLTSGEKYWVDLSVRNVGLSQKLSNPRVTLKWTETEDDEEVEKSVSPPVTLNSVGQQGYFPVAYRGWALAGYRSEGTRGTTAIIEGDFRPPGPAGGGTFDDADDACAAQPGGCKTADDVDDMGFAEDYPRDSSGNLKLDTQALKDQIPKVFAYVPTLSSTLEESWQVVDAPPRLMGTATTSRSSRLSKLPASPGSAGSGLSAPSLWGSSGPAFSIMAGVGPLSGAFAFGWSGSVIDYMDMNGDGFPDVVTPSTITYTNPRGGRSCFVSSGKVACDGSGAEVVQKSTTLGVGGGLGGAPIGISANTKGRTNATQGNSTNKGGPASDKSYGADLGLSLGFSASWTNPNAADPSWKSQVKQDQLDKVPGDDPTGPGLATEQVLADINGDGLPDRISVDPQGVFVYLNLGYGFAKDAVQWSAGGFESGESYSGSLGVEPGFSGPFYDFSGGVSSSSGVDFSRYAWADVNGDGLLDALHKNEPEHKVEVAFGSGTGIGSKDSYGTFASLPFDIFPGIETDLSGQQIRQDQAQSLGGGVDVTIGFPLCAVACYLIVNPGGHFENSLSTTDIDLQDVNGDGAPDSVKREALSTSNTSGNHEKLNVRLNTLGKAGLLQKVTTPMGGTVTIDYAREGNTLEHPESMWVLSDVKIHSSRGNDGVADQRSTYEYGTPRYAFAQREDLGFDRVVESQRDGSGNTLRSVVHDYRNGSVFDSGLETSTTVFDGPVSSGKRRQRTETDWQVLNLTSNLPLSLEGVDTDALLRLRAAPQIQSTTQTWYDAAGNVGQQSTVHYQYDRLGNPIVIDDEGDPTNPDDDVVAHIRYSDCTISASYGLNLEFGCSDGFAAPDPDDPDEADPVPAKTAPAAHAPYWSKDLCPTWTSVPAIIAVRDADGGLLRYRDGAPDVCDNTSVTYLKEMIDEGSSLETSTYAVTQLAYDDWGSYNRIIYPEDENGRSYAVFYVYDAQRRADIARVTDLSVDADAGGEFLDPTALGELADDVSDSDTTLTIAESKRAVRPPAVPFDIAIGDETLTVTAREIADEENNEWTYTVERGVGDSDAAAHDAGADVAIVTDQPQGDPVDPDQADLLDRLAELGEAGVTASATFDGPSGRVSSRTDASGNVTRYEYDALSRTKRITHPDGGSVSFDYEPTDEHYPYAVARHSDEFNSDTIDTATFVDGSGRVTGQKHDASFFDGADKPTQTGWAVGGAEQLDALGRVVMEWYPTKQLTGNLTDYWDKTPPEPPAVGGIRPIRTQWDALDRVVSERAANDAETKTTYGFGTLDGRRMATTEITDPKGRKSVRYLDVRDYTRAVDDIASGLATVRTRYDVDGLGQLHSVQSAPTEAIEHEYDVAGRRTSTTTPDGGKVTYGYDASGNLISKRTPVLRSHAGDEAIKYGYEFGHLVSIDYPDSTQNVRFRWGGYSGVAKGDNGGGRIVDVVDAARHQELGYDENGNVDREATTMSGRHPNRGPFTTAFDYDWLGRLGSVTLPDTERVTNDYDAGGRLSSVSGAKACTALGTLTAAIDSTQTTITVTENPNTGPPSLPFTIRIGKEQLRVTARTATADPSRWTYTVERGINGTAEAPTNVAHAAGERITSNTAFLCRYPYLDRREYDEFGSRVFQAVGNKVTTRYTRESDTRRLSGQVTNSPAAPFEIQDLSYKYDLAGNLELAENNVPADVPSLFGGPTRQKYTYDNRYRIAHAEGTWDYEPKTRRSYTYDVTYDQPSGNTTSIKQRDWTIDTSCKKNCKEVVQPATTYDHSSISYAADARHRFDVVGVRSAPLSRDYDYDPDGNVTRVETATDIREIGWNADDRMTHIVDRNKSGSGRKETSYAYDYNGNLALEIKETGQTSFVNPWVTVRNSTMWKHIWADDDRLATKFSEDDSYEGKLYFLHKDLQGSTNVVTDTTGKVFQHHEYFPSGDVWIDESSTVFRTPYQFTGGYVDEDHDLVNMGQRWYEPGVQAFTSVDPVLTDDPMAIVDEPELRSSYAYARNNPLTYVDTNGRRFGPVHVPLSSAFALAKSLKIDGEPLTEAEQGKLRAFFITKSALRGRMAYFWLSRQQRNESRQNLADLLDSKPVLEFEFENGKLNKIKLGFGVGKRKKLLDRSTKPPASTQTSQGGATGANTSSGTGGTGPSGGPPNKPLPPIPTSGGSKAGGPVASGQTSAGGGNTAATTGGKSSK
jgi:RHS repeat-associated protein